MEEHAGFAVLFVEKETEDEDGVGRCEQDVSGSI